MHVAIQTVDGQFFQSDDFDIIDSGLSAREFEERVDSVEALFRDWRNADFIAFEIGGRQRYFNPVNVLWAEVVR